jgi:hypothetical protein
VLTTKGFVNTTRRIKMNNNIKIEAIEDHDDGSATLTLDLNAETYHKIFEYGFIKLIMKGIESEEKDKCVSML